MQNAIDHLEKNKVFIDTLQMDMIPLSEAYRALEMAIDNQIAEVMETLQGQIGGLVHQIEDLNTEEND
jgi:uncharacterized protein YoxC